MPLNLEQAPGPSLAVDQDGRIVAANVEAHAFFGYGPWELVNQSVEVLVPMDLRVLHKAHRAAFNLQPRTRQMGIGLQVQALRKDGTTVLVEVKLQPLTSVPLTIVGVKAVEPPTVSLADAKEAVAGLEAKVKGNGSTTAPTAPTGKPHGRE